jgi:transcriptional regulator with XRE-family HTH domain
MLTLGDAIRRARQDAQLEQSELAQQIGVSRPLISKWERGKSYPTVPAYRRIAEATGADWLLDLRGVPETHVAKPRHAQRPDPSHDGEGSGVGVFLASR